MENAQHRVEFVGRPSNAQQAKAEKSNGISSVNYQQRQAKNVVPSGRISNNEDLSESSHITQINLLANVLEPSDPVDNFQNVANMSQKRNFNPFIEGCRPHQIQARQGSFKNRSAATNEARTPTSTAKIRRDSFYHANEDQASATSAKKAQHLGLKPSGIHCAYPQQEQQQASGQKTDVGSVGTKHRRSMTKLSNEISLTQTCGAGIGDIQSNILVKQTQHPLQQCPAELMKKVSPSGSGANSVKRLGAEQIISIFDRETEKSYLLEKQPFLGPTSLPNECEKGPSIYKVQEVGTARFKCLPVTDYGKIMNLHRQREQRKVQTADGPRSRNKHINTTNAAVFSRRQRRGMPFVTSQETFVSQAANAAELYHTGARQKDVFSLQHKEEMAAHAAGNISQSGQPSSPTNFQMTSNLFLQDAASRDGNGSTKRTTVWTQRGAFSLDKGSAAVTSGKELRNSRSTATSAQRKDVLSRTTRQVAVTCKQLHQKTQQPFSLTSSKNLCDQAAAQVMSGGHLPDPKPNLKDNWQARRTRTKTARTPKLHEDGHNQCCCPTVADWQKPSQITFIDRLQSMPRDNQVLLTAQHQSAVSGQSANRLQHKKSLRKRAQSQGCGLPIPGLGAAFLTTKAMRKQANPHVEAKLVSIASDLRKKLMPRQHLQMNEVLKERISSYLSLLAIQAEPQQHAIKTLMGPYEEGNEPWDSIKWPQVQSEEISEIIQELEIVDNVKPLRNTIIESVRAMPSYYIGRVRKDPVKLKQFELKVAQEEENDQETATARLASGETAEVQPSLSGRRQTLQAVIKQNRDKLLLNRGVQVEKGVGIAQKDIVTRNKTNMVTVSADEVDRMLFKSGLALGKKATESQKREALRQALANRRMSDKSTVQGNASPAPTLERPVSTCAGQKRAESRNQSEVNRVIEVDFDEHIKLRHLNLVQKNREAQLRQQNEGAVRRSLTLNREANGEGLAIGKDQASPFEEEVSFMLLSPKATTDPIQSLPDSGQLPELDPQVLLSHYFANDLSFSKFAGTDLNHVVKSLVADLTIHGSSDIKLVQLQESKQSQKQLASSQDSKKIVKTYEFHLPMHNIREESSPDQKTRQLNGSNPAATGSRYNLSKQSTVYRIQKKRTWQLMQQQALKRDDISSQMLENDTVADQQNSLRNLNFMGSSFYIDPTTAGIARLNQSQTAIRKRNSHNENTRRFQCVAQSLEALTKQMGGDTDAPGRQSIELGAQNKGDQNVNRTQNSSPRRPVKQVSYTAVTNRGGASADHQGSVLKNQRVLMMHPKMQGKSPLMCLSTQDLQQRDEKSPTHPSRQKTVALQSRGVNSHVRPSLNQTNQLVTPLRQGKDAASVAKWSPQKSNGSRSPGRQSVPRASQQQFRITTQMSQNINHNQHTMSFAVAHPTEYSPDQVGDKPEQELGASATAAHVSNSKKNVTQLNDEDDSPQMLPQADAFVVFDSNEGHQDLPEINGKNFELFGSKTVDSRMKLTASSISKDREEAQVAHLFASSVDEAGEDGQTIEVVNISQAVQTQPRSDTDLSSLKTTPQIQHLYITRSSQSRDNTPQAADYDHQIAFLIKPRSPEAHLLYIQQLLNLSVGEPRQKQVRVQQFESQLPKTKKKSTQGYPSHQRKFQKQFRQPHFRKAQMYMTHDVQKQNQDSKLLNQLRGEKRFKTFKANNELYLRIDGLQSEVDANEQIIYDALIQNLVKSLPSHSGTDSSQPTVRKAEEQDRTILSKLNKQQPFDPVDFKHQPSCPLHTVDTVQEYHTTDERQLGVEIASDSLKDIVAGSIRIGDSLSGPVQHPIQVKDSAEGDKTTCFKKVCFNTIEAQPDSQENLSGLSKYQTGTPEVDQHSVMAAVQASHEQKISLNYGASTVSDEACQQNLGSLLKQPPRVLHRASAAAGCDKRSSNSNSPVKRLSQNITQPVLWQINKFNKAGLCQKNTTSNIGCETSTVICASKRGSPVAPKSTLVSPQSAQNPSQGHQSLQKSPLTVRQTLHKGPGKGTATGGVKVLAKGLKERKNQERDFDFNVMITGTNPVKSRDSTPAKTLTKNSIAANSDIATTVLQQAQITRSHVAKSNQIAINKAQSKVLTMKNTLSAQVELSSPQKFQQQATSTMSSQQLSSVTGRQQGLWLVQVAKNIAFYDGVNDSIGRASPSDLTGGQIREPCSRFNPSVQVSDQGEPGCRFEG